MTNKVSWLLSIFCTFAILLFISLCCLLSWNFPYFADAMTRAYGGVIPKEEFVERIICFATLLPFTFRGVIDFIALFSKNFFTYETEQKEEEKDDDRA